MIPPMNHVIDYAHSQYKSDWIDVFLWAKCRFFIGANSGPVLLPNIFGVPSIMTNCFPLFSRTWSNDLFIPKKNIVFTGQNRFLSFRENLSSPIVYIFKEVSINAMGYVLVDNSPKELDEIVTEMIEILDNKLSCSTFDNYLQNQFDDLEVNIDYTGQKVQGNSRIGNKFIHRYQNLLS